MVRDFAELLALWRPKELQALLGTPKQTIASMYRRASIGPNHWARIIECANARGEWITAADLIRFRELRIGKTVPAVRVRDAYTGTTKAESKTVALS